MNGVVVQRQSVGRLRLAQRENGNRLQRPENLGLARSLHGLHGLRKNIVAERVVAYRAAVGEVQGGISRGTPIFQAAGGLVNTDALGLHSNVDVAFPRKVFTRLLPVHIDAIACCDIHPLDQDNTVELGWVDRATNRHAGPIVVHAGSKDGVRRCGCVVTGGFAFDEKFFLTIARKGQVELRFGCVKRIVASLARPRRSRHRDGADDRWVRNSCDGSLRTGQSQRKQQHCGAYEILVRRSKLSR